MANRRRDGYGPVIGSAVYRAIEGSAPDPSTMGVIAVLALIVNVAVAVLLYGYRNGDSNKQSIWLCSRNNAIGNVAVMVAAAGVFASGSRWPDLIVAAIIAVQYQRCASCRAVGTDGITHAARRM